MAGQCLWEGEVLEDVLTYPLAAPVKGASTEDPYLWGALKK